MAFRALSRRGMASAAMEPSAASSGWASDLLKMAPNTALLAGGNNMQYVV